MKNVMFEMSQQEILLLISLVSDQLFRREFIDPKMPGYKGDPADLAMGKELVVRLKSLMQQASQSASESISNRNSRHTAADSAPARRARSNLRNAG